jgi:hypothetical protein
MAIILLPICYLCYVQFCFQVYGEAKEMLIIALFVQSETLFLATNFSRVCVFTYRCKSLSVILLYWSRLVQVDFMKLWNNSFFGN